jgi:hypothetical protein
MDKITVRQKTTPDLRQYPGRAIMKLVELRGLEPLTPSLPVRCATSCAIAPNTE